ncbi:MAG TPA: MFS transporter [Dissulfurispiraceae bacterium]|nr:MFS transporter [Dissulfurispiraceae bacterium]
MGFASGLPRALPVSTLQAWMAVEGVDLKTIGIFAVVALPYTLKFLWSPLMDRYVPPFFGRRRGWILITQALLAAGIASIAFSSPGSAPMTAALLALVVSFLSASQDIVIDAYRTDILNVDERGSGAAVAVMGYRIAMIVSGSIALILSDQIGWRNTYLVMSSLMAMSLFVTMLSPEPEGTLSAPRTISDAVIGPLKDYFARPAAVAFLVLIILYKLADAYASSLATPFLIKGLGFSATDVGTINKGLGLVSTILGALIGGSMMVKLGLFRSLLYFGIVQALTILSFSALAILGKSYGMLIFAVAFENFGSGMGTAAFMALLMTMCNHRFSATQYAMLSSLAALGGIVIAPTSGFIAEIVGWPGFFLISAMLAIPGLLLLVKLREIIIPLDQKGQST